MRSWMAVALVGSMGMVAVGCGGRKMGEAPANLKGIDFPDWVVKGSGAFSNNDKERVFYGVGQVSGIKNMSLARSTADNRARAEIGKIFETYSASLMKDYAASTTAGDQTVAAEEQHVEQAIKTFSAATLNGVQVVDHWFHPTDGSIYALASLDLAAFTDSMNKAKDLNARVRDYVRANAEKAHADLEKEEAKHSASADGN